MHNEEVKSWFGHYQAFYREILPTEEQALELAGTHGWTSC